MKKKRLILMGDSKDLHTYKGRIAGGLHKLHALSCNAAQS